MDWNEIQNFSSNIVFGVLLFALVTYWVNLALFRNSNLLAKIGRFSTIIANGILFFSLILNSEKISLTLFTKFYFVV